MSGRMKVKSLSYRLDAEGCEEQAFYLTVESGPDLAEVFVEREDEPLVAEIVTRYNYHERLVEALRTVVDAVHDFDPGGEAIDNTYTEGAVVLLNELLDTKKV